MREIRFEKYVELLGPSIENDVITKKALLWRTIIRKWAIEKSKNNYQ